MNPLVLISKHRPFLTFAGFIALLVLSILLVPAGCKKSSDATSKDPFFSAIWEMDSMAYVRPDPFMFKSDGTILDLAYAGSVYGQWKMQGSTIKFAFTSSSYNKQFHFIGTLSPDRSAIDGMLYLFNLNDSSLDATDNPIAFFKAYAKGSKDQLENQHGTSGMNIAGSIAALNAIADTSKGYKGRCAKFIRLVLEAGGVKNAVHPTLASDYGPYLTGNGFIQVTGDINDGIYTPAAGDVVVFKAFGNHTSGHIQMYSGSGWVSDTGQPDFFPSTGYKSPPDPYVVYRP